MPRRAVMLALALSVFSSLGLTARADDPRFAQAFVDGLRQKGYHDLAIEYLGRLRAASDTPPELRALLDYEEGLALIDAGVQATDPERAKELFDQARTKLEAFIEANPNRPETSEAIVALAHLLYERGRTAMIQADELDEKKRDEPDPRKKDELVARKKTERDVKLNEARASFAAAREAYGKAYDRFDKEFQVFAGKTIAENDPRYVVREKVQGSRLNAELQKSVVDYEEAQTYPMGSAERNALLDKAGAAFEKTHHDHRTQMAGITARMWQAKCFEERGNLKEAAGIYSELMDHSDPRLVPLQKKVNYFRIIVMSKRKEYALAADECVRWLTNYPNDRRSYEALGIQLELAKNILAQMDEIGEAERSKALQRVTDSLKEVVRVYSPFKAEAVALLKQVSPKAAVKADDVARMSFDDALGQADGAISLQQFDQAISILQIALKKGDAARDVNKFNRARYTLAFCYYMSGRFYEAAILTEHLARRYPGGEWSAKATEIAMAAMIDAYNKYTVGDRASDLRRLIDLARYTSETWPETEQGDAGKMTVGQISLGSGKYADAIAAFGSVRPASSKWADAQGYAGDAHWKYSLVQREAGKSAEADAEVAKAIGLLNAAIKTRRSAGATSADVGLVTNVCDLAGIYLETGKGKDALALLEPIARDLNVASRPAGLNAAYGRTMSGLLRAHVANGQVDAAIADMATLEKTGGETANRAQLYFELGKLLEREIEALRKRNDRAGLGRTQEAYRKFLDALVKSQSGQTFESLSWAGSQLIKLGAAEQAETVLQKVLDVYGKDEAFVKKPGAGDRLMRVRLKVVAAQRSGGKFDEASSALAEISAQNPRLLEPQMEGGYLIAAKAEAKKVSWNDAFNYWQKLALRMRAASPKPVEYFEAWYNAALALNAQGKSAQAKQTLAGVMRLSPTVGSPEMKQKYQELIATLK